MSSHESFSAVKPSKLNDLESKHVAIDGQEQILAQFSHEEPTPEPEMVYNALNRKKDEIAQALASGEEFFSEAEILSLFTPEQQAEILQTDVLIEYLQKQVFKGAKLPKQYEDAIAEWKRERAKIEPLATSSTDAEWKKGSQMLADLAITKLARELPVEAMYRLILNDQARKDKPLPSTYTWTAGRASDGGLVDVGRFVDAGASVGGGDPVGRGDDLGVSFSRS